ncbi:MAG: hypothetical protein V1859_02785 [archaeon]
MVILTDKQILEYIKEEKILPNGFKPKFKVKNSQNIFETDINGESGNIFRIIVRQNQINPLNFSVIFGVILDGKLFRLKRYNGDSHEHTNKIEGNEMEGFHIHTATQRYQENGFQPEGFAESTKRYSDWLNALKTMLHENNFKMPVDVNQKRMEEWN